MLPLAVAEWEVEVEIEVEVEVWSGAPGQSMWALDRGGCWQGPVGGRGEEMAQQQVQGLALVQEQGQPPRWGRQQVPAHYFQRAQADPGWSVRSAGAMIERWGL